MSTSGRTLSTIRDVIKAGLVGQTLTGTGSPSVALDLTLAPMAWPDHLGARECVNGGVTIWRTSSQTRGRTQTSSSGGNVQRKAYTTFRIEVGWDIQSCNPSAIEANLTSLEEQLVDLVEAALEPASGGRSAIEDWSLREPRRTPDGSFLFLGLDVTVRHFWIRAD